MTLDQLEARAKRAASRDTSERSARMQIAPDYILKLIRVARAARMYASSPDELETALKALTPETGNE